MHIHQSKRMKLSDHEAHARASITPIGHQRFFADAANEHAQGQTADEQPCAMDCCFDSLPPSFEDATYTHTDTIASPSNTIGNECAATTGNSTNSCFPCPKDGPLLSSYKQFDVPASFTLCNPLPYTPPSVFVQCHNHPHGSKEMSACAGTQDDSETAKALCSVSLAPDTEATRIDLTTGDFPHNSAFSIFGNSSNSNTSANDAGNAMDSMELCLPDFGQQLPWDVSLEILSYLDNSNLQSAALACRQWNTAAQTVVIQRYKSHPDLVDWKKTASDDEASRKRVSQFGRMLKRVLSPCTHVDDKTSLVSSVTCSWSSQTQMLVWTTVIRGWALHQKLDFLTVVWRYKNGSELCVCPNVTAKNSNGSSNSAPAPASDNNSNNTNNTNTTNSKNTQLEDLTRLMAEMQMGWAQAESLQVIQEITKTWGVADIKLLVDGLFQNLCMTNPSRMYEVVFG